MDITLYHSPGACSTAPCISLFEAGAAFRVEIVSLRDNEQMSPEYASINPKRKVPYLVVDGKGLSENVAIQCWIAEAFPDAGLLPSDGWERKRAISHMGWFGSGLHPHVTRHFKTAKFCALPEAEADVKAKAKEMYMAQLELVERELEGRKWFFDHYTVCDSYFFWIHDRALREGFDLSALPNCSAHNERMRRRESVKKTLACKAS